MASVEETSSIIVMYESGLFMDSEFVLKESDADPSKYICQA